MSQLQTFKPDRFRLATDADALRNSAPYEQVRHEINRRTQFLGGTNWLRVSQLCEQLALEQGLDLLLAIYYTIAAVKTRGIIALADGLELQAAVLRQRATALDMPPNKRAELYRWMLSLLREDLRTLTSEPITQRDLYRCDRALQSVYTCLQENQPDDMPDLEALSYTLNERIAQLEKALGTSDIQIIERRPPQLAIRLLVFGGGLLLASALWAGGYLLYGHQPAVIERLTEVSAIPRAYTPSQLELLRDTIGPGQIQRQKHHLVPLYAERINTLMTQSDSAAVHQVNELSDTLNALYPNSPTVIALNQQLLNWRAQLQQIMDAQAKRFATARTRAANISRYAQQHQQQELQRLTKGLEDYAISLSPLMGRVSYIETLLKDGQIALAQEESDILDTRIKALLLKHGELREQLMNR